jgi:hypothetical protein
VLKHFVDDPKLSVVMGEFNEEAIDIEAGNHSEHCPDNRSFA